MKHRFALFCVLLCSITAAHAATTVNVRVLLAAPLVYGGSAPTMTHSLSQQLVLPLSDPYGVDSSVRMDSLPSGIVDWIVLEFRTAADSPAIFATPALLHKSGRVVAVDGQPPRFPEEKLPHGRYFIVVAHRNHLDIMSAAAVQLHDNSPLYDFTQSGAAAYSHNGSPAQLRIGSVYAMCWGDVVKDNVLDSADFSLLPTVGSVDFPTYSSRDCMLMGKGTLSGVDMRIARRTQRGDSMQYSHIPNAQIYRAKEYSKAEVQPVLRRLYMAQTGLDTTARTWAGFFGSSFCPDSLFIHIEPLEPPYTRVQWYTQESDSASPYCPQALRAHTTYLAQFTDSSQNNIAWTLYDRETRFEFSMTMLPDQSGIHGTVTIYTPQQQPNEPQRAGMEIPFHGELIVAAEQTAADTADARTLIGWWEGIEKTESGETRRVWLRIQQLSGDSVHIEYTSAYTHRGSETEHNSRELYTATQTIRSGNTTTWSEGSTSWTAQYQSSGVLFLHKRSGRSTALQPLLFRRIAP